MSELAPKTLASESRSLSPTSHVPLGHNRRTFTFDRPVQRVAVQAIVSDGRFRALDLAHVNDLAESILIFGLVTPVLILRTAAGELRLMAGRHRVEAVKALGHSQISALVLDEGVGTYRPLQISEALHAKGRTVLEQAELLTEYLGYVRDRVGQVDRPSGGKQPANQGFSEAARLLEKGRKEAGRKKIARAAKIASLSPAAKRLVCELRLDDNQAALLEISKTSDEAHQLETARKISQGLHGVTRHIRKAQPGGGARTVASQQLARQNSGSNSAQPRGDQTAKTGENEARETRGPGQAKCDDAEPAQQASQQDNKSTVGKVVLPNLPDGSHDMPPIPSVLDRRNSDAAYEKLVEQWKSFRAAFDSFRAAFDNAPQKARERFVREVPQASELAIVKVL